MFDNNFKTIKTLLHSFKSKAWTSLAVILFGVLAIPALAQGTPPSATANCTVTAMNRTAPLQADYSFTIYNIPGAAAFLGPGTPPPMPPFRVRAACSDGTVGETNVAAPEFGSTVVYTGELFWRAATPIPLGLILTAAQNKLTGGQTTQLTATGVLANSTTVNLDTREKGTYYSSSNPLIADVNQKGFATVTAGFATGSSARIIMTAQNEGVAGSTLLQLGPRGSLTGKIYWADGTTPVPGARVSIVRNQPRELLGTVTTDVSGSFTMDDVSAGSFSISVIEPSTGDQGRGNGFISADGDTGTANISLNGQGTLTVTVVDGSGNPVSNAEVTFTSLSAFRDIRTLQTNVAGQVVLERAMAGPFTVSTRDDVSNLVGTIAGTLIERGTLSVTLKLQASGTIAGTVLAGDGTTVQAGVQVRVVSSIRGVVTQAVTGTDGKFKFDALPLTDSPYSLDAMLDGRLRARVPNLILATANQELAQNIVFSPSGTVTGIVTRAGGSVVEAANVSVQSQVGQKFTFVAKTDKDGKYTVAGVPVGAFSISASAGNGETASGGGNIGADGAFATLNMQLASSGIVGTVFGHDGVTVVGAGVNVTMQPGNVTTQTSAQGQFSFNVTQPNTYTIEASDATGNRGRTSVVLTVITPNDPKTVNVTFLGRGSVQGVVREPGGAVQAGLTVNLNSSGIFGGAASAVTNAQGVYRIDGQFVGGFTVTTRNATTQLAGSASGAITTDGAVVATDIILAATGSVSGKVLKQDNATPLVGGSVVLYVNNTGAQLTATTDATGSYSFLAVPLSTFTVTATNPIDGDKGQVSSRLTTLNEVRTLDVRLLGQGPVKVRTIDANNQPVAGVSLTLISQSAFGGYFYKTTGNDGVATFDKIFNGDFSVTATKNTNGSRFDGSASGTLLGGITSEVVISNKPVGVLTGLVTKGLNSDPQASVSVALMNLSTGAQRTAVTDAQGRYTFDQVEVSIAHRLTVSINNRTRARADVTLSVAGATVTRDLVVLGAGTVSGKITNAADLPQASAYVVLTHPDPTYGGSWQTYTQANGNYSFADVPAGNFTIRAYSSNYQMQAQDSGSVRFDADAVILNLTLLDSAVTMPRNLYDANAMTFDLQGDGSIGTGTSSVFRGNNNADVRASRLEVVVNGVAVPFQNGDGSIGRLTQAGQLLELDELNTASGLNITRRVYVPKTGYFARHLEVLENRTASPITVGIKISSNFAPGYVGARIVDSSNNDNIFDVSSDASRDRWVIVDDEIDGDPFLNGSQPAVAMVFDGLNADAKVGEAGVTALGSVAKTTWQWKDIVVQPGTSVGFMHFVAQQLNRSAARAAAERLGQLPPEALEGLTAEERAIIKNFKVPTDGVSTLAALPSVLNSTISGKVYAGDGSTVVPYSSVIFKSESALYGRTFSTSSDASGKFSLSSPTTLGQGSPAVAQDRFYATASHPRTGAITPVTNGEFIAGQSSVVQDLIFTGTGVLKGTVKRSTGALVTSGTVYYSSQYYGTSINADGTYILTGLAPQDYAVRAEQSHPQGQAIKSATMPAVTVTADATAISNIVMEDSGEVTGTIRAGNGDPKVAVTAYLDYNPWYGTYRSTATDTAGKYRFTDVSLGNHVVSVFGNSGEQTITGSTTVVKNAESVVNLQFAGLARVNVQVKYQRGVAVAAGAYVVAGGQWLTTNSGGQVSFEAPFDTPVSLYTYHPDNSSLQVRTTITVPTGTSSQDVTLTLPAAASIRGTVYRPDGLPLTGGLYVSLRQSGSSNILNTSYIASNGSYLFNGIALGNYSVTVQDPTTFKFADADVVLTSDGQEVTADLKLEENRIALPSNLFDANGLKFDIQKSGSIGVGGHNQNYYYGSQLFSSNGAGVELQINGQAFTGDDSALMEANRRQLSILQSTPISGLTVTRKVFVPANGYFARYLEILQNPSVTPVTVDVKLKSVMSTNAINVVDSSSGDAAIKATGTNRDTWVVLDDSNDSDPFITYSQPATAFVLGAGGVTQNDKLTLETVGSGYNGTRNLETGWSAVTVPANGRVVLMHFVAQQINRAGAKAAAQRLQSLPSEALQSLDLQERNEIVNFSLPADGVSVIPALPSLLGNVSGTVYEGNGATVVPNTRVAVRSQHPLFNRKYDECHGSNTLRSNATGVYSIAAQFAGGASIAIPQDSAVEITTDGCPDYYSYSGHPLTGVSLPAVSATFVSGSASLVKDIIFPTGILTGTVVGPADYGVSGGYVSIAGLPRGNVSVNIAQDGTYLFPGLPGGTFALKADIRHNQGTGLRGQRDALVTVGQVTVTDIETQATGSVQGVILKANGEAYTGASVWLSQLSGNSYLYRATTSDALGKYNLSAVPVGQYMISVIDPQTNNPVTKQFSVTRNQITIQNIMLLGTGTVNITVKYGRGIVAPNLNVYFESTNVSKKYVGTTDANGQLKLIANIGSFTLSARHPENYSLESVYTGTIATSGEQLNASIVLKAIAQVRAKVITDAGGAIVEGATVIMGGYNIGVTDANGLSALRTLSEGSYTLEARLRDGQLTNKTTVIIDASVDGQIIEKVITNSTAQDYYGTHTFVGEKHLFSINANAGDQISVLIRGAQSGNVIPEYGTYATVYDTSNLILADGYTFGSNYNSTQYNTKNDLKNIATTTAGLYGISIRPLYDQLIYLGAYRLEVSVNGAPVNVQSYQGGGTVIGTVFKTDGVTTAANQEVQIQSLASLPFTIRKTTDAFGNYRFDGVPIGTHKLTLIAANGVLPDNASSFSEQQSNIEISAIGQTINQNLTLPKLTKIMVNVTNGITSFAGARVYFNDGQKIYTTKTADANGMAESVYAGDATIKITAYNPQNYNIYAEQTVVTNDGVLNVNLIVASGSVSGSVARPNGSIAANTYVTVLKASDRSYIASVWLDSQGVFSFDALPSNVDLIINAQSGNLTTPDTPIRLNAGQVITGMQLTLPSSGSVTGIVKRNTGEPIAYNSVSASYMDALGQPQTSWGYTDAVGSYRIDSLPINKSILLSSTYSTSFFELPATQTVTLGVDEEIKQVDLIFTLPSTGTIVINAVGPSNESVSGQCFYQISTTTINNLVAGDCQSFTLSDIPVGVINVKQVPYGGESSSSVFGTHDLGAVQVLTGQITTLTLRLSKVSGVVKYYDNQAAVNPYVIVSIPSGESQYVYGSSDGSYTIYGLPADNFSLEGVQSYSDDPYGGLRARVNANLVDVNTALNIDVLFPPTGRITGTLRNRNNQIVPNATVIVESSNLAYSRYATTDAEGKFDISKVVLGDVSISAYIYVNNTYEISNNKVQLTTAGQTADVALVLLANGAMSGTVTRADGSPVANSYIVIKQKYPSLSFESAANTNGQGKYIFNNVHPGEFTVVAHDPLDYGSVGLVKGILTAGSSVVVDAVIGNGVSLGRSLQDTAASLSFYVGGNGYVEISNSSTWAGYAYLDGLILGDQGQPYQYETLVGLNGREVLFDTAEMARLKVTRRVYVPPTGGYVRVIDTFENSTASAVTVPVKYSGCLYDPDPTLAIVPSSNDNRYGVQFGSGSNIAAGYVFTGANSTNSPTRIKSPTAGDYNGCTEWAWDLTLPANSQSALLNYMPARNSDAHTDLINQTEALSNMNVSGQFEGLDASQRSKIINFSVPAQ